MWGLFGAGETPHCFIVYIYNMMTLRATRFLNGLPGRSVCHCSLLQDEPQLNYGLVFGAQSLP